MSTELQIVERAEQALGFADRKAALIELAKKSERITEITNEAGKQECHAARMRLKNTRVGIQAIGKEARDDAVKTSRAIIAKEKELICLIEPEEERLQKIQDEYQAARDAERAEVARIARERVEAIRKRIDDVRARLLAVVGQPADIIKTAIEDLQALDLSDLPKEFQNEGHAAKVQTIDRLIELHTQRVAADVEAARLTSERAELDARRRAQDEEERAANESRAEADRIAREQREREEAEQNARLEAEARERRDQEERERAERQRQEDEARAIREREQAEADERNRAEQKRLDAERAEFERQREESARAAREKEIQEATLYGAAVEAVDFLREKGFGDSLIALKLAAAVGREKPVREAA